MKNGKLNLKEWEIVKDNLRKAHGSCKDIKTVGWDIGLTNKTWPIIEGNFGFGITIHQSNLKGAKNPISDMIII